MAPITLPVNWNISADPFNFMAIHTSILRQQLIDFLHHYTIGSLISFEGIIEGVENTNYRLHTSDGIFILTIYEGRTSIIDLPFFHDFTEHLWNHDIPCPKPIRTRNKTTIHTIASKPAAIISFLKGNSTANITARHCRQLGCMMAKMHHAAASFPLEHARDNDLSLSAWDKSIKLLAPQSEDFQKGLSSYLTEQLDFLHQNWQGGGVSGIIHGDLFPDNVFFEKDNLIGVIDFYFSCVDYLGYDLAIALNAWCFDENHAYDEKRAKALFEGYESVRPLTDDECRLFHLWARGSALRFLLTRLEDWTPSSSSHYIAKDPLDYVKRLEFHSQTHSLKDYGVRS